VHKTLHYQPKVCIESRKLQGFEALVRWRHPVHGLIPPDDFIPLAEETGLIVDLGDWVLNEACRQVAAWGELAGRITVAVNVSAQQLLHNSLVDRIAALTMRHGIEPSRLQIELTESVVMAAPETTAELLQRLRKLGVTVAVDDFGTGYSSLSYLRRLPIDVIKIDRSFVMSADSNDEDAQIVRTVIALGQALRLDIVAEGVETPAQAALLQSLGCSVAQGFLYAKPGTGAQVASWLGE
jgi:EAL domain-containing protein (putative c-di-GMP-specific phosphodiesterase class I)